MNGHKLFMHSSHSYLTIYNLFQFVIHLKVTKVQAEMSKRKRIICTHLQMLPGTILLRRLLNFLFNI
jgi:hypothetical protein